MAIALAFAETTAFAQSVALVPSPQSNASYVVANPILRWSLTTNNFVVNGGFESASLSPWVSISTQGRMWLTEFPIIGAYERQRVASQSGYAVAPAEMYQEIAVPTGVGYATLFWAERADSYSGSRDAEAYLRVDARASDNRLLRELASVVAETGQAAFWRFHSADLTPWIGQTVRIAFVAGAGKTGNWRMRLDDVRLLTGQTNDLLFRIHLGTTTNLDASEFSGESTRPEWTAPRLEPSTTYFWRVDTVTSTSTATGTVWRFTTAPRSALHHFSLGGLPNPQLTNVPSGLTVAAEDFSGHVVTNHSGAAQLSAYAEQFRPPRVLVSEVAGDAQDAIEFVNAGRSTEDLSNWQVLVYDASSTGLPSFFYRIPSGNTLAPGQLFALVEPGAGAPLPVMQFTAPKAINWTNFSGISASVLLLDERSNIVDFVTIGQRQSSGITNPIPIPRAEWRGSSVSGNAVATNRWSRQRVGVADTGSAADWGSGLPQIGTMNLGLGVPLGLGFGELRLATTNYLELTNGSGTALVAFSESATNVVVEAAATGGILGRSAAFDVQHRPYLFIETSAVREGDGTRTSALKVRLQVAQTNETMVQLAAMPAGEVIIPGSITIAPGKLEVDVPVTVIDDVLLDGPQTVAISGTSPRFAVISSSLQVLDNETAELSISFVGDMAEGGTAIGQVTASRPPDRDINVQVAAIPADRYVVNGPVVLPAGQLGTTFQLTAVRNGWMDDPTNAQVTVSVENWAPATALFGLSDPATNLQVVLPVSILENAATMTNAGRVRLDQYARSNTVIALAVQPTGRISLPPTVTVMAGQSNATFNLTAVDNADQDGNIPVTITATASGFSVGLGAITVEDDDPAYYQLQAFSPQFVGISFTGQLQAFNASQQLLRTGNIPVTVTIEIPGSTNPPATANTVITNGIGSVAISPTEPGVAARLVARGRSAQGESAPINILEPISAHIAAPVRDMVWIGSSNLLLATVSAGASNHPNEIVVVDVTDGSLQTWASVPGGIASSGNASGRMAASPDGSTLFVVATNGSVLQAWNVASRTIVASTNFAGGLLAVDLAPIAANPWQLALAMTAANGFSDNLLLLNSSLASLASPISRWARSVIAHPAQPNTLYVFHPYQVAEWLTGVSGYLSERKLRDGPFPDAFQPMAVVDGRLFNADGAVIDLVSAKPAGTLDVPQTLLASPPSGLMTTDADYHEVLIASRQSATVARIQGFGSMDLQLKRDVLVPISLSTPRRLLKVGASHLAVVAADTLSLLHWPVTLPGSHPPVDLGVAVTLQTTQPRIRTNCEWTIVITNQGASTASDVRLRIPVPPETEFVDATLSRGQTWFDGRNVQGHVIALGPGASQTALLTLRAQAGGWVTNLFGITANETEETPADNAISRTTFIGASGQPETVERLNLAVTDLAYDPAARRLFAIERIETNASQTRVLELDIATMSPRTVRTLNGRASHLRLSGDGRFLYAALSGGRSAYRIDLVETNSDLTFDLFETSATNRWYFLDLQVDPTDSAVVVAAACPFSSSVNSDLVVRAFYHGALLPQSYSIPFGATDGEMRIEPSTRIATLATSSSETIFRFSLNDNGLSFLGSYFHLGLTTSFVAVEDRFYTSFSEELAADSGRRLRGMPTVGGSFGFLRYQASSDRLIFLENKYQGTASNSWPLQVLDRTTLARLGIVTVPVEGSSDSMALLEDGRIAIAVTAGKLMLVSNPMLQQAPPADLAIHFTITPSAPRANETVRLILVASNRGPSVAVSPGVTCELPSVFTRTSVVPAPARILETYRQSSMVFWTNFALPPCGTLTFEVVGSFPGSGPMSLAAGVADRAADVVRANNRVAMQLQVSFLVPVGQSARFAFPVLDAVYDQPHNRVLATVTANEELASKLVSIDPDSGVVLGAWSIGIDPSTLALADDGRTLYVGTGPTPGVSRVDLESMQVVQSFSDPSLGATPAKMYVNQGNPGEVVVRIGAVLYFFRNGVLVPSNTGTGYDVAPFAPNLMVIPNGGYPYTLKRFRVTFAGLILDVVSAKEYGSIDGLRAGAGLLFAYDGRVFDPLSLTQVGSLPAWGPMSIDATHRLVHFVADPGKLRAYDIDSGTLVREEDFGANLSAARTDLFRAGTNLFVSRQNQQLVFLRSRSIPTQAPADLSIGLSHLGAWRVGEACEWTVAVTNAGPNPGTGTRIDLRLPPGMAYLNSTAPAQLLGFTNQQASFSVGDLAAGQVVTVHFAGVARTAALSAELVASARSEAVDDQPTNNSAKISRPIEIYPGENRLQTLPIPASDMTFDPVSQLLYLSCSQLQPGVNNVVVAMDPRTGLVVRRATMPGVPLVVAASDDGQFLYVSLNAADQVIRLHLPGLETDLVFPTLRDTNTLPRPSCDIAVMPGNPRTIAVSRFGGGTPDAAGVWIYDDGIPRPLFAPGGYRGNNEIAAGRSGAELLAVGSGTDGYELRRYVVDSNGIASSPQVQTPVSGYAHDLHAQGNSALLGAGKLHELQNLTLTGVLATTFVPQTSCLSTNGDRAVLAAGGSGGINFVGFRTDTLQSLGTNTLALPNVNVARLVLWGTDGIAALGGGQVILGRLNLAAPAPIDLDLDGVPDWWEAIHGMDPTLPDGAGDLDGDGSSNLEEYLTGTDPQLASSVVRIQTSAISAGRLRLVFPCPATKRWRIETTSDLNSGIWSVVGEAVSEGGLQWLDVDTPAEQTRFFRVRIVP